MNTPLPEQTPGGRVAAMDALRGFALLGILVMNSEFFARPLQGLMLGMDTSLTGADAVVGWLSTAFVQGKFWVLFSLLFGMGFAELLERARSSATAFVPTYARRLAVLLVIGMVHACLVWAGDILILYTLGGAAMLLCFRYTPLHLLWKLGLLLHLLPLLFLWLLVGMVALFELLPINTANLFGDNSVQAQEMRQNYAAAEAAYRDGTWLQVTRQRLSDTLELLSASIFSLPSIVGVFLIGAWMQGARVLRDPSAHARLLMRFRWIALPVGAALAVAATLLLDGTPMLDLSVRMATGTSLMTMASLLLALGYLAWLLRLMQRTHARTTAWLAAAGRMALSNYLLQSLVFSTLFYGYGFGLWGEVSRVGQVGLAVAFFALQLLLSRWWMRGHRHGPVEWLWRAATYLRRPAWRVPA